MERQERVTILKRIVEHSFWMGFETAILLVAVLYLILGQIRGEWGPLKRAFEVGARHEESLASGEVQPDEQSEQGDG